jgi:hypothetical protein
MNTNNYLLDGRQLIMTIQQVIRNKDLHGNQRILISFSLPNISKFLPIEEQKA